MNVDQRRHLLHQRKAIQQKLDTATHLLSELKKVQNDRLSSNPPPHLGLVRNPSTVEHELGKNFLFLWLLYTTALKFLLHKYYGCMCNYYGCEIFKFLKICLNLL